MNTSRSGVEVYISNPIWNRSVRRLFLLDVQEADWYLLVILSCFVWTAACQRLIRRYPYYAQEFRLRLKLASLNVFVHQNNNVKIAKVLFELGLLHKLKGNIKEALHHFEDSMVILETSYGVNHPSTAACHTLIASVLGEAGHFEAAMEHFNQAIFTLEDETAEGNVTVRVGYTTLFASVWNNMAVVEKNRGHYSQALLYYKKALQLFEEEECDVEASIVYNNMSLLLLRLGKRSEALMSSQKAIDLKITCLDNGPRHLSTAISYNNRGLILSEMERYDEAMSYHSKALEIKKRVLGTGHRSTSQSCSDIDIVHEKLKSVTRRR